MKQLVAALLFFGCASSALAVESERIGIKGVTPGMTAESVAETLGTPTTHCEAEDVLETCQYAITFAGEDVTMSVITWEGQVIGAIIMDVSGIDRIVGAFKSKYGRPIKEDRWDTIWLRDGVALTTNSLKDQVMMSDMEMIEAAQKARAEAALSDI